MPRLLAAALLVLGVACGTPEDPLVRIDAEYTKIMAALSTAERDTARNVHNREARRRKVQAEKRKVAFFREPRVRRAIEEALTFPEGSLVRTKGEAYMRQLALASAWTEDERAEEARLVARIEAAATRSATWESEDGGHRIDLDRSWPDVARDADGLSPEQREDLARSYVEHRMAVLGADLQELVRLRNRVARRAGASSYWEVALAAQGLSPDDVARISDELARVVRPVHEARLRLLRAEAERSGLPLDFAHVPLLARRAGMRPDRSEADALFDADLAEERVMTAFQDMGIPTDGWEIHSGPRRTVRAGVYGFPVRPPELVAIVMSQDRRWSMWQYEALAHEGGHAVWWKFLDDERAQSPVLWSPPDNWFEGFAQFFERLVYEPAFTARYVPDLPDEVRADLPHWRRRRMVDWITDAIVQVAAERRLYEDPTSLEAVQRYAAETRAQLTGLPPAPATEAGLPYDPALLSTIVWNYPAYSANYLYAYVGETWMWAAVEAQVGPPVGNPGVGPLIRDRIVRAPAETPFEERLSALLAVERTRPLRDYIEGPPDPADE